MEKTTYDPGLDWSAAYGTDVGLDLPKSHLSQSAPTPEPFSSYRGQPAAWHINLLEGGPEGSGHLSDSRRIGILCEARLADVFTPAVWTVKTGRRSRS